MTRKSPAHPERSFGVSVGTVLLLFSAYFAWRGRTGRAEIVGAVGASLLTLGLVRPMLLTWPSAVWWRFSRVLGHINARLLLTLIFALVLVPIGLLWRLMGRDPLGRHRPSWPGWSPHPARYRDREHYSRMF